MNRLVVHNLKGGVGKTTLTLGLAAQTVRQEGKVCLVIDLDFQANASTGLGVDRQTPGIDQFVTGAARIVDLIQPHSVSADRLPDGKTQEEMAIPGLFIVPAGPGLLEASRSMSETDLPVLIERMVTDLRTFAQATAEQGYAVGLVIFDTRPDVAPLALLGLSVAECLMIPCPPEAKAIHGAELAMQMLSEIRASYNPDLDFGGIIVNNVATDDYSTEKVAEIRAKWGKKVLKQEIRSRPTLKQNYDTQLPITWQKPDSEAAGEIRKLTAEILRYLGREKQ